MLFSEISWLGFTIALFLGLGCGSYATMPAHRLPRGEPSGGRWVGPRSRCPSCDTKLRTRDLLPVFNWLLTWGKCHFCSTKISLKYLFIEASSAVLSVLLYLRYNFSDEYLLLLMLAVSLVIILSTDWHHHIIPKQMLMAILLAGVAYRILQDAELFQMVNSAVASMLACFAYKGFREQKDKPIERYDILLFVGLSGVWINEARLLIFFMLAVVLYFIYRMIGAKRGLAACFILPLFINIIWDIPKLLAGLH